TDLRNALHALTGRRPQRPSEPAAGLQEDLSGQLKGIFTFTLIDEDGAVVRQQEHNALVDEGRNELLQYIADRPETVTNYTFSGDGGTTVFTLPYPYKPVADVIEVVVDGNTQTEHTDFSVDYAEGEIHFDTAPSNATDNVSVDVDYFVHPFRWLAVGTDGSSVADGQTSLGSEATRINLDSDYTVDESAVQVTGQWTFGTGEANVSIAEAGLFAVPPSAPITGTMLNRTVVSPTIEKSSSQELQVTWTLSMS
ncbi:hypothetical protein BRD15_10230, partial [Halobacteriales archaeon SW_6_65_15]